MGGLARMVLGESITIRCDYARTVSSDQVRLDSSRMHKGQYLVSKPIKQRKMKRITKPGPRIGLSDINAEKNDPKRPQSMSESEV